MSDYLARALDGHDAETACLALEMIRDNTKGESYSAGLAMSALASIEERGELSDCFWHPGTRFTMAMQLCDDDGIVRSGRFHDGTDYPCTGGAHFAGEHIFCTSPAHANPLAAPQETGE
jgi:hypothetical protein